MPEKYQLISENNDSTVVSDYVSPYQRDKLSERSGIRAGINQTAVNAGL